MNSPYEIADDKFTIKGACIVDAGRFAGVGRGLLEDLGKVSQEKADLLERRLSRLEQAFGLDPICGR
ncbi:hypothetical protein D3C85_1445980 [compost metagenome]